MEQRERFDAAIRVRETLEIDNSALEAEVVARRIAARYSLPLR